MAQFEVVLGRIGGLMLCFTVLGHVSLCNAHTGQDGSGPRADQADSAATREAPVQKSHDFKLRVVATDAVSVNLHWSPQDGAGEYRVSRDGSVVGSTVGKFGYFSDFDLQPRTSYVYTVAAYDAAHQLIGSSAPVRAKTTGSATIRTHYKILALAFNPDQSSLVKEDVFLRHRIEFLALASLGSAQIDLYKGGIVSVAALPAAVPGTNDVDYQALVTRRDFPGLDGNSLVDLIERGDIDHVWVVKSAVNFGENAFIGMRPIQGPGTVSENSWAPIPVQSSRSFFVNGYLSDERSYDAYAHMVEGIMTSVSDGQPQYWPRNLPFTVYTHDPDSYATEVALLNLWERYRVTDGWNGSSPVAYAAPGNANIGSSHFPASSPRTCSNYCYFDQFTWQRYVDSTADDWLAFPNFSDIKRKINGYEYGAYNYYAQGDTSYAGEFGTSPEYHRSFRFAAASYHQWFFGHLPHNPGVTDGKLNNWWPYLFDFNRFGGSLTGFEIKGLPAIPTKFEVRRDEYGTELASAEDWGYWHSQNGFSPGAKAATLSMVRSDGAPKQVTSGSRSLMVRVENTQDLESLGTGRNDVFYPKSRNAHWNVSGLQEVRFSIKLGENPALVVDTNPILRLHRNGGNRIEFVPHAGGVYANLFLDESRRDAEGWYHFSVPLVGDANWEKNVFGYVDPNLSGPALEAAKEQIEKEILSDLNYVEISIRSGTSAYVQPDDVITYYIDGLQFMCGRLRC